MGLTFFVHICIYLLVYMFLLFVAFCFDPFEMMLMYDEGCIRFVCNDKLVVYALQNTDLGDQLFDA